MRTLLVNLVPLLALGPENLQLARQNTYEEFDQRAEEVCQKFYSTLDNPPPSDSVRNDFLAQGGQSRVYRCYTTNNDTDPAQTANKMYLTTIDKNLTEIEIINTAASEAGIRSKGFRNYELSNCYQFSLLLS